MRRALAAMVWVGVLLMPAFASAAAGDYHVRIVRLDQRLAVGAMLTVNDLPRGWSGGELRRPPLLDGRCGGYRPRTSDLTITGHAAARFLYEGGVEAVYTSAIVFRTAAMAQLDWARRFPQWISCAFKDGSSIGQGVTLKSFRELRVRPLPAPVAGHAFAAEMIFDVQAPSHVPLGIEAVFLTSGRCQLNLIFSFQGPHAPRQLAWGSAVRSAKALYLGMAADARVVPSGRATTPPDCDAKPTR